MSRVEILALLRGHADALAARTAEHRASHARDEGNATRRRYRFAEEILREVIAEVEAMPEPEQPAPVGGEGDVWAEIIETLPPSPLREACEARRALGISRYGQPLRRGDGRDHRRDLLEELLDAAVYAQSIGARVLSAALLGEVDRLIRDPVEVLREERAAETWRTPPDLPEPGVMVLVELYDEDEDTPLRDGVYVAHRSHEESTRWHVPEVLGGTGIPGSWVVAWRPLPARRAP